MGVAGKCRKQKALSKAESRKQKVEIARFKTERRPVLRQQSCGGWKADPSSVYHCCGWKVEIGLILFLSCG